MKAARDVRFAASLILAEIFRYEKETILCKVRKIGYNQINSCLFYLLISALKSAKKSKHRQNLPQ